MSIQDIGSGAGHDESRLDTSKQSITNGSTGSALPWPKEDAPILNWALAAASRGWPVFPLRQNGKTPFGGSSGHLDSTLDREQIAAWFANFPNSNYGIYAGFWLTIMDVDQSGKKDGWAAIQAEFSEWPKDINKETFVVETPTGGSHLYYTIYQNRIDLTD